MPIFRPKPTRNDTRGKWLVMNLQLVRRPLVEAKGPKGAKQLPRRRKKIPTHQREVQPVSCSSPVRCDPRSRPRIQISNLAKWCELELSIDSCQSLPYICLCTQHLASAFVQGKELGSRFKALSPEEKKKYEDMAAQDKIRYQKEMAAYKAKQKAGPAAEDSDDDGVDDGDNGDDSDSDSDSD